MRITSGTVVSIDYTLTDPQGEVIDSSEGSEPLSYLHGHGNIIPGLEAALENKEPGASFKVTIEPNQGYGDRNDELTAVVERSDIEGGADLEVGAEIQVETEQGEQIFTVIGIEGDKVTIDGNHPLAGVTLAFDVQVRDVRQGTKEELDHGHSHHDGHAH